MRLILAILIALSLFGGSASASPVPMPVADCSMGPGTPAMPHDEDMPCCTPDCATPAASAVLPRMMSMGALTPIVPMVSRSTATLLLSINPSADDPPPRVI